MLEPITHSFPVRVLDSVHRTLEAVRMPPLSIRPRVLVGAAQKKTGLADFGDDDYRQGLEVLCQSAQDDCDLNIIGRVQLRSQIKGALITRLRRVELQHSRPDIASTPLIPPLIVIGLPRSGTTYLHRLLSLAPTARPIPTWELLAPIPGPGADNRRENTIKLLGAARKIAPVLDAKHQFDADEPEECMMLFDETMVSLSYFVNMPVISYLEWFMRQDLTGPYRTYRWHLQHLQQRSPGRRLTLKAPMHTGCLDALLSAVPEAMIVQTHRDVTPVVGSLNSLLHTFHSLSTRNRDTQAVARVSLKLLSTWCERNIRDRGKYPGRILDIEYDDLIQDPAGTVARIYHHYNLNFTDELQTTLIKEIANRPQYKYGSHEYSIEEAGLSQREVQDAFSEYKQWRSTI